MTNRYYALEDPVWFDAFTHNPSGAELVTADETPKWSVFEEGSDTPILEDNMRLRSGFAGTYIGSFVASGTLGFESNKYYSVHVSGKVGGITSRFTPASFVIDDVYDANVVQISGENYSKTYYANIKYVKDAPNAQDEYIVSWYRNGEVLSSGDLSNPAISVYDTSDGSVKIEDQTMDFISNSLAAARHNETVAANILPSGEPFMVVTSGTIDSATRTWKLAIGLDDI